MSNYKKTFVENLIKMRKMHGFTQKHLAELLGFSEKTVSKWERGNGFPDIETIFKLSEIFRTNIETLFKKEEIYYLGIDGGGTKTELALADKDGNIVRILKTDPCNPVDIGIDAAKETLKISIYEICKDIPFSNICMFAGIAGGNTGKMKESLEDFFKSFNFLASANNSDNENIIAAGLGKKDGITLILGTGICAFTQKNEMFTQTSGWGYFIDNGGSGFNLGRDALNAYFCAFDGSGNKTLLTQEIDAIYPGGPQKLISYIYGGGKKTVASFAPAVFEAVSKGDKIAEEILKSNMALAAHIIDSAAKKFDSCNKIPVILAGGLTNHSIAIDFLKKSLKNAKKYQIDILSTKPVYGAVKLARQLNKEKENNE